MIYTAILNTTINPTINDIRLVEGLHKNNKHRWFVNINMDNILFVINNDINNHHDILTDIINVVNLGNIVNMPYIQSIGTLGQMPKDSKKAKEYKRLYGKQL